MNIEYVARHFRLDDETREYANQKLSKAIKFLDEPVEIRVILEVEKRRKIAEINAAHRYGVIQANAETDDLRDAINVAVDKVEKQARRGRKKAKGRKRRPIRGSENQWPVEILAADTVGANDGPRIVKSSHLSIKPMSLEEAALALEGSKNEFVVFRNSENDEVSVLYRRHDQDYGLITPEL